MLPAREKGDDLFALEVQGDSMIDAMVNNGDYVIMKRVEDVNNGEMVAVWLKDRDETTLKYLFKEEGRVRLQPANPTMQPIIIDDPSTVEIQGKVVMVIRQVKTVN
jgi:repressor LexA